MFYVFAYGYNNRYIGYYGNLDTAVWSVKQMVEVHQKGHWLVEDENHNIVYQLKAYNGYYEYEWHRDSGRRV